MNHHFSFTLMLAVLASPCFGHAGGLDKNGGHHDKKNGGYHVHSNRSSNYDPPKKELNEESESNQKYRSTPRTEPRTDARLTSRETAREPLPEPPQETPVETKTVQARYEFHDVKHSPYQVVSFTESKDYWKVLLAKGFEVQLKKEWIVRIEPISDPKDFRTWHDSSGKFAVVAKCVDVEVDGKNQTVSLSTLDHKNLKIKSQILSDYDKAHVRRILQSEVSSDSDFSR